MFILQEVKECNKKMKMVAPWLKSMQSTTDNIKHTP